MKKKEQKLFLEAVKAFEQEKGISSEILLDALKESFRIHRTNSKSCFACFLYRLFDFFCGNFY